MKASDNQFPSITLEEVASDGSDLTNPAADHRRLFLGEDGALHLRDSAGSVTAVGGGDLSDQGAFTYLDATEDDAPTTPASGFVRIYAKADGRIYSKDDAGTEYGPFDASGSASPATISGGTETSGGGYNYHAFTTSGTLTVSADGVVDVLIVGAGGGGGGYYSGGGGGGGAVLFVEDYSVVAGSITVTIGAGGAGGGSTSGTMPGSIGSPSVFGTLSAPGGGGGGGGITLAGQGCSSGGGGATRNATAGSTGTAGLGYAGGAARTGTTSGTGAGGGGGGAGAVGADAGGTNNGAAGGAGILVSGFTSWGESGYFGAGGGGGGVDAGGAGGNGGGGDGGGTSANTGQTAGAANSGGGGGGGGNTATTGTTGAAGGSGLVVVRVPTP